VGKVTNYVDFAFRISSAYLMKMEDIGRSCLSHRGWSICKYIDSEFDLENITTDAELH
jgi:hypothetical protein